MIFDTSSICALQISNTNDNLAASSKLNTTELAAHNLLVAVIVIFYQHDGSCDSHLLLPLFRRHRHHQLLGR